MADCTDRAPNGPMGQRDPLHCSHSTHTSSSRRRSRWGRFGGSGRWSGCSSGRGSSRGRFPCRTRGRCPGSGSGVSRRAVCEGFAGVARRPAWRRRRRAALEAARREGGSTFNACPEHSGSLGMAVARGEKPRDFVPNTQRANDKMRVTSKNFLLLFLEALTKPGGEFPSRFFDTNVQQRPRVEGRMFLRSSRPVYWPEHVDKSIEFPLSREKVVA